ncbi:hypothetical protein BGP75_22545 [Motiliproteus sp. MSK22-1]|nr:hypothetical protein BGP75_22545 [Motiliproteus sp. MSK22-1]
MELLEAGSLDQFSMAQLSMAEGLILCGMEYSLANLSEKLLLSGCGVTTFRVLFSERLGENHRHSLADGSVDLILPMAVGWVQARNYLKRLMVDGEPLVGIQALQDPELASRFLPDVEDLTHREQRVLKHLYEGLSNEAIAEQMAIATNTVKVHLANICRKTGASNRTQALCLYDHAQVA